MFGQDWESSSRSGRVMLKSLNPARPLADAVYRGESILPGWDLMESAALLVSMFVCRRFPSKGFHGKRVRRFSFCPRGKHWVLSSSNVTLCGGEAGTGIASCDTGRRPRRDHVHGNLGKNHR